MGGAKSIAVHLIIHAVNTETCIVAFNRYRIVGFYCEKKYLRITISLRRNICDV